MTLFMLDADTAIYAVRRQSSVVVMFGRVAPSDICLSALVHSQLMQGIDRQSAPDAERRLIDALAAFVAVVPYDLEASIAYRHVVAALGFSRRNAVDRMIAAHSISLDATLVTNNVKDFAAIPDLKVVNWATP